MAYELVVRRSDIHSERIMQVLLERRVPFAEIQLNENDAEAMESVLGRKMPFVVSGPKLIGGFSDVVNHLRRPSRAAMTESASW